ncbi:MAG: hypothetical protein ACRDQA_26590 [Nocardioidaceae bacterium]
MWRRRAQRLGEHEARCRDEDGHRTRIGVGITDTGRVTVAVAPTEVRILDLLEVGRLRALLRDAVFAVDEQYRDEQYRDEQAS